MSMNGEPTAASNPEAGIAAENAARRSQIPILTLGAIGVVYGDIGTSPIYALREALNAVTPGATPTPADVMGVLSIIFWSLTLVVALKYAVFVLSADHRGEGGTFALLALARMRAGRFRQAVMVIGLLGAALFFGDAAITPAISVLSAVEGLEVLTPDFTPYVLPATIAILATLFAVQGFGTHRVSSVFGPITSCWFLMLGASGISHLAEGPAVLAAFNPVHAIAFIAAAPGIALVVLGAAFLVVTGAEALYADLGHFGRVPIWLAWFGVAFPCLTLNYFGQGAYILAHGGAVKQPFFEMMPPSLLVPAIILTTLATIIASQAVITGAFSLAQQAGRLGMLPRLDVIHTSDTQIGQIYVPRINGLLFIAVLMLVILFGSSSALASAYGLAVSGNMVVTSVLLAIVMRRLWRWPVIAVAAVMLPLMSLDLSFLVANSLKFLDGGWATVTISAAIFVVMWTWRRGSKLLFEKTRRNEIPLAELADNLAKKPPHLVKGTAVFLTGDPQLAPTALLHSLKHYGVLHESNVILTVATAMVPRVAETQRVRIERLNDLFLRVILRFGYMEEPDLPKALIVARKRGWKTDIMSTSFFLSRRTLKVSPNSGMPAWQDRLYIALTQQAADATAYFSIPTNRAVELGTQVTV